MMLWKNRNKKVGLCVVVVTAALVLATIWAVLATPETALAHNTGEEHNHGGGGSNPGGNVVKQDIPGKLTLTGVALTSDDPSAPYSNLEAGTNCFIGRRRSIWVTLSKNSPRSMNLELGGVLGSVSGDPTVGYNPWGVEVMTPAEVQALGLPNVSISQVELQIAPYLNVSGLTQGSTLLASTWLLFLDGDNQWGLYFGPGRTSEAGWGGARFFTNLTAPFVHVERTNPDGDDPKTWTATSTTPGFLWYRGSKKNAPWVYVGKCNVPWSCDVEDLP